VTVHSPLDDRISGSIGIGPADLKINEFPETSPEVLPSA
jgi:hypothetical protein